MGVGELNLLVGFDNKRLTLSCFVVCVCVYIYILFGPVKPELGVIPSGQENHSKAGHLNFSSCF